MRNLFPYALATGLSLTLAACTSGLPDDNTTDNHTDTPTAIIDNGNALAIAADVYQVAAVDAPFTASIAMQAGSSTAINTTACTDPTTISGGNSGNMMGMGMDMMFDNCVLSSSPSGSGHTLTVNGSCSNSDGSSAGIEVVTGDKISFTTQGSGTDKTLGLHGFSITRDNDVMTQARGAVHRNDGGIITFSTSTDFVGTAMTPTAGSLIVSGAAGTRLRLTITSGGASFTLEVDADGDGNYDNALPLTERDWNNDFWLALMP